MESFAGTDVKVNAELYFTDRKNPENSKITKIDLGPGKPQVNVAALRVILEMRG